MPVHQRLQKGLVALTMRNFQNPLLWVFFWCAISNVHAQLPPDSEIIFMDVYGRAIFLTQQNRTKLQKLTDGIPGFPTEFSPSPDGRKITLTVWNREVTEADIFVKDLTNKNLINLTGHLPNSWNVAPQWSPDGRRIAFRSNRDGLTQLFVMNADGSDIRNLIAPTGLLLRFSGDAPAAWSPDSQQIAFPGTALGGSSTDLFIINVDGTGLKKVVTNAWDLAWSPDGKLLAFSSTRARAFTDIYTLDLENGNIKRLTTIGNQGFHNGNPSWLPDGSGLLFTSQLDSSAIWYTDVEGKDADKVWRDGPGRYMYIVHIMPDPPQAVSAKGKDWTTWGSLKFQSGK